MTLIRNHRKKNNIDTDFINQVYDEIVTETRADQSEEFHAKKLDLMRRGAQRWIRHVPVEVDGQVEPYWTK